MRKYIPVGQNPSSYTATMMSTSMIFLKLAQRVAKNSRLSIFDALARVVQFTKSACRHQFEYTMFNAQDRITLELAFELQARFSALSQNQIKKELVEFLGKTDISKEYEPLSSFMLDMIQHIVHVDPGQSVCDPFAQNLALLDPWSANAHCVAYPPDDRCNFLNELSEIQGSKIEINCSNVLSTGVKVKPAEFDYVLTSVPVGLPYDALDADARFLEGTRSIISGGKRKAFEFAAALRHIYYVLKPQGCAIVIFPESFLFPGLRGGTSGQVEKPVREQLIDLGFIKGIFLLEGTGKVAVLAAKTPYDRVVLARVAASTPEKTSDLILRSLENPIRSDSLVVIENHLNATPYFQFESVPFALGGPKDSETSAKDVSSEMSVQAVSSTALKAEYQSLVRKAAQSEADFIEILNLFR